MPDRNRFLLTRKEAAEALGMSLTQFERYVQPHLPCLYVGRLRQYRPRDIDRWVDENVTEGQAA